MIVNNILNFVTSYNNTVDKEGISPNSFFSNNSGNPSLRLSTGGSSSKIASILSKIISSGLLVPAPVAVLGCIERTMSIILLLS